MCEVMGSASEQQAGGDGCAGGPEQAAAGALAAFHAQTAGGLRDAVGGSGAAVRGQGVEWPIILGDQAEGAIVADQDGHSRARLTTGRSGFGGVEELGGALDELTHRDLIGR